MAITTIKTAQLRDGAEFFRRNGSVAATADFNLGNFKITNLGTPTDATDAATKGYVDALSQGIDPKESVMALATTNYSLSGTATIDDIPISAGQRVALVGQTNKAQNGIWVVRAGSWTRPDDFVTGKVSSGAYFFVEKGTTSAHTGWILTTDGTITVDTTEIDFTQFNAAADVQAGDGMTKTGNTLNVVTASSTRIVVNPDNIDLATTGVSAGTYTKVTVDVYGRVTVGASATTSDIAEGTNLYYTDGRVSAYLDGAISTVLTTDLTASRALISNGDGKIAVSSVTATELGYVSGVSSAIQTQLNSIKTNYVEKNKFIFNETPTGTINGTNKDFDLANPPLTGKLMVFLNGVLQAYTSDYTLLTSIIRFVSAPVPDDVITATYLH